LNTISWARVGFPPASAKSQLKQRQKSFPYKEIESRLSDVQLSEASFIGLPVQSSASHDISTDYETASDAELPNGERCQRHNARAGYDIANSESESVYQEPILVDDSTVGSATMFSSFNCAGYRTMPLLSTGAISEFGSVGGCADSVGKLSISLELEVPHLSDISQSSPEQSVFELLSFKQSFKSSDAMSTGSNRSGNTSPSTKLIATSWLSLARTNLRKKKSGNSKGIQAVVKRDQLIAGKATLEEKSANGCQGVRVFSPIKLICFEPSGGNPSYDVSFDNRQACATAEGNYEIGKVEIDQTIPNINSTVQYSQEHDSVIQAEETNDETYSLNPVAFVENNTKNSDVVKKMKCMALSGKIENTHNSQMKSETTCSNQLVEDHCTSKEAANELHNILAGNEEAKIEQDTKDAKLKQAKTKRQVRACADYIAAAENEISFCEGDTIVVLKENDSGWWLGRLLSDKNKKGWFPCTFVERLEAI